MTRDNGMSVSNAARFFTVIGAFGVIPLAIMWSGFVIACLWDWFVVSSFGLAPLSIASAFGLALTVRALRPVTYPHDQKKTLAERAPALFGDPACSLFLGWILKSYFI